MSSGRNIETSTVGQPLPPSDHAISVSLPTWLETLGYKKGDSHIIDRMQTGYPRYFIHLSIRKLARFFETNFASPAERSLLLVSLNAASAACDFLSSQSASGKARILDYHGLCGKSWIPIYVIIFPSEMFPLAKLFWQHTGLGISSRLAEKILAQIEDFGIDYLSIRSPGIFNGSDRSTPRPEYESAIQAKKKIRHRILDILSTRTNSRIYSADNKVLSSSGGKLLAIDDIFLYPTGMSAIWSAHQLCLGALGNRKSVCFGFPYSDTLKVLQKWGPGCLFYADGKNSSIDDLEEYLRSNRSTNANTPPLLSLFTEFPSNPLLHSVDLHRLRNLADEYNFLIVVDETIGNFSNVDVLPLADIVVTSLSKFFSGYATVMGGSLVLNPNGKYSEILKNHLVSTYEDYYFDDDAIVMEHNSRDFLYRVTAINYNSEALCEYLRSSSSVISRVYYPKWHARENYSACQAKLKNGLAGYGGLFSLLFVSQRAAQAFYDSLSCSKGPSLGTNFTLACPYALLAHFGELEWAADHGVPVELVRISVGVERLGDLMESFRLAVKAAEESII